MGNLKLTLSNKAYFVKICVSFPVIGEEKCFAGVKGFGIQGVLTDSNLFQWYAQSWTSGSRISNVLPRSGRAFHLDAPIISIPMNLLTRKKHGTSLLS